MTDLVVENIKNKYANTHSIETLDGEELMFIQVKDYRELIHLAKENANE